MTKLSIGRPAITITPSRTAASPPGPGGVRPFGVTNPIVIEKTTARNINGPVMNHAYWAGRRGDPEPPDADRRAEPSHSLPVTAAKDARPGTKLTTPSDATLVSPAPASAAAPSRRSQKPGSPRNFRKPHLPLQRKPVLRTPCRPAGPAFDQTSCAPHGRGVGKARFHDGATHEAARKAVGRLSSAGPSSRPERFNDGSPARSSARPRRRADDACSSYSHNLDLRHGCRFQ